MTTRSKNLEHLGLSFLVGLVLGLAGGVSIEKKQPELALDPAPAGPYDGIADPVERMALQREVQTALLIHLGPR